MAGLFDFDTLVDETMEMVLNHHGKNPFDFPMSFDVHDWSKNLEEIPESCGLLFRIKRGEKFFRIHCSPTLNMKQEMQEFYENFAESQRFNSLENPGGVGGAEGSEAPPEIYWFATEFFQLAQNLTDHVNNKKFPCPQALLEEGSSYAHLLWWLKDNGSSLKIYYNPEASEWSSELIPLGYLGEGPLANQNFFQWPCVVSHCL